MCGIAGIIGSDLPLDDVRVRLDAMRETMDRRGPDDARTVIFKEAGSGLAARRLSIIDLEGGAQPIANEDESVWAVLHGEIYNHVELRRELEAKGHRFRTRCDTEVLVHLWEEHGADLLDRLHGMFGLAVFDTRQRRLLIARDGAGMKPLYWAETKHGFLFATQIRAILASGLIRAEPDLEAVDTALASGLVPAPRSGFKGIHKMVAGSYRLVRPEGARGGSFWSYRYDHRQRSASEHADDLEQRLRAAVASHLVADVPVGLLLSGGWDSSLVAALAVEQSTRRLKSFSVVFPEAPDLDEGRHARLMADTLGTEHHEIDFRIRDYETLLRDVCRTVEEPLATSPDLVWWRLMKGCEEMKVLLSGEGSDELFAGYDEFRLLISHRLRFLFPRRLAAFGADHIDAFRWRRQLRILAADDDSLAEAEWYRKCTLERRRQLLPGFPHQRQQDLEPLRLPDDLLASCRSILDRRLAMAFARRLSDGILVVSEKLSAEHAIELRMPFLDRSVVDFGLSLPSRLKLRGRQEKFVLSILARRRLPAPIARRRKFGLRNPKLTARALLQKMARELLLDTGTSHDFFDRREIERFIDDCSQADTHRGELLWTLCRFQGWWAVHFDDPTTTPSRSRGADLAGVAG
jgi:asparagine synthase (glutamine-hydrolysing)